MQDARVRLVIIALVVALAIGTGATWLGNRRTPPPILITGAASASPNPASGDPGDQAAPVPSPSAAPAATPTSPSTNASSAPNTDEPSTDLIYVHVAGAVKHPDIYTLKPGSRVVNAIKAAGGAKPDSDLDAVNLAEKVVDGEKIYIPRKGETSVPVSAPGNTIGLESSSPEAEASGASDNHRERRSSGRGHESNKLIDPSQGRVNLNTATAEQLERLPGIGPAMAARIIEYRKTNGGFKKPSDLMDIAGIGEKKMAKLAPFVVVR